MRLINSANLVLHDLFIPSERAGHAPAELVCVDTTCNPPSAPKAGVRGVLKMATKWRPQTNIKKVKLCSPALKQQTPNGARDARIDDLFCELGISSTTHRPGKADDAAFSAAARMATLCSRAGPSMRAIAAATNQRRTTPGVSSSLKVRYAAQQVRRAEAAPPAWAQRGDEDETATLKTMVASGPPSHRVAARPGSAAPR